MRFAVGCFVVGCLALSVAAVAFSPSPARAAVGVAGELGAGGSATGDISKSGGETDEIGLDLVAGAKLDVRWTAHFPPTVVVLDPDGAPADLGLDGKRTASVKSWPVAKTGHYRFQISAASGTQGGYTLVAKQRWDARFPVTGVGDTSIDVPMPAGGFVRGVIRATPDSSFPKILSFTAPSGAEQLAGALAGRARSVTWKGVPTPESGPYRLVATADSGTRQFEGTLLRRAPRVKPTKLDLRNGIDPVSYVNDGVGDYFKSRCGACHAWARTYSGARGYARLSLGKMRTGKMPKGGPRADAETLDLVSQWIVTGYPK